MPPAPSLRSPPTGRARQPAKPRLLLVALGAAALVGALAAVLMTTDNPVRSATAMTSTETETTTETTTVTAPPITYTVTVTATAVPVPSYQSPDDIASTIRSVTVGDCVYYAHTNATTNNVTKFYSVPCTSITANYRVTKRGTAKSVCTGMPGAFVWTDDGGTVVCIQPKS